jgi:hypothetical protein
VIHDGHERVQQARIVAAAVKVAEALEQALAILPPQILGPLDAEPDQHPGYGRPHIG